jgi:RHS repeat-associated protein
MSSIANYVDGTPSGPAGIDDLKTSYTYDAYGQVLTKISDDGVAAGLIKAQTKSAYDLLGNVTTSIVYADTAYTVARTTTAAFDEQTVTISGTTYKVTRPKPTGSRGPIAPTAAPALVCPGSTTDRCNSVTVLDVAGHPAMTYDAYGVPTLHAFDLDGHEVRTVVNYLDGIYDPNSPDTDITTDMHFNINGGVVGVVDVLGHKTTTLLDALGHATKVVRDDDSWTRTDFTPAGRTAATSRPGASDKGDADVAWSKNVYDAAGRQTSTLSHWDRSGAAQLQVTTFETGTAEGVSGSSNWAIGTASTITPNIGTASSGSANTGFGSLGVTTAATAGSGISLSLTGTFLANHHYMATVYGKATTAGQNWRLTLGAAGATGSTDITGAATNSYTPYNVTWNPTSTYSSGVLLALVGNQGQSSANSLVIDDIAVWDIDSATSNIFSTTVYDKDGHAVASILPGGAAGEAPMVTRTAYDTLGRVTDVTVAAVSGAGTSGSDANLNTHTDADALGRTIDVVNPLGVKTAYAYNRLGQLTDTWLNYVYGGDPSSDTIDQDAHSTFAYDAIGEMIGYCSAENQFRAVQAGTACDPVNVSAQGHPGVAFAWHFASNSGGRKIGQTPPVNSAGAAALDATAWTYDVAGHVTSVCDYPAGQSPCTNTSSQPNTRHTDTTYNALGQPLTVTIVDRSSGADAARLVSTTTYSGFGTPATIVEDDKSTQSNPDDSLAFSYDSVGQLYQLLRGSSVLTTYTYNPDGTIATRTDGSLAVINFGYDWAGRQISASGAGFSNSTTYAYRLDGLLAGETLGNGETLTLSYDPAHRPTRASYSSAGTISQAFDRAGDVTSEWRTLGCAAADACTNAQTFAYDGLGRVTASSGLTNRGATTYTYDLDSNRTSKSYGGVTWTYTYDRTDELVSESSGGTPQTFGYDAFGDMTTKGSDALTATTYAYDLAGRLTGITPPSGSGNAVTFTYDALSRQLTRLTGGATDTTYRYIGTSQTVYEIAAGATTDSFVDTTGARIATRTGAATGWTLSDLHGDVVGDEAGSKAVQDAFRFDAYGETVCAYSSGSGLSTPWRYQGRLDLSPNSGDPLYDAGARFYAPSAAVFTSLDSVAGSAINPKSMNRFLYAEANPATLVDPTGHCPGYVDGLCLIPATKDTAATKKKSKGAVLDPYGWGVPVDSAGAPVNDSDGIRFEADCQADQQRWSNKAIGECILAQKYRAEQYAKACAGREDACRDGQKWAAIFGWGSVLAMAGVVCLASGVCEAAAIWAADACAAKFDSCQKLKNWADGVTQAGADGQLPGDFINNPSNPALKPWEVTQAQLAAKALGTDVENASAESTYDLQMIGTGTNGLKGPQLVELLGSNEQGTWSNFMAQLAHHWLKGPPQGVYLVIDVTGFSPSELNQVYDFLGSQDLDQVQDYIRIVASDW